MTNNIDNHIPSLTGYEGTLKKPLLSMTPDERESYYQSAIHQLRERLFAIGQPLVYRRNGEIVAEYANGIIEKIR